MDHHDTKRSSAFLVLVLLISQSLIALAPSAMGDAADWGETVGDVLIEHSWGHGSSTNLTTDNTTLDNSVFRLSIIEESTNVTDQGLDDGHKFNLTVSDMYRLALNPTGAYWVNHSSWNLTKTDIEMYAAVPVLGDLDDDGDLDIMVGAHINDHSPPTDDGLTIGINNTGDPSDPSWAVDGGWNCTLIDTFPVPALGDLDDDGDLDMMLASGDGKTYGVENTGTSTKPQWTARPGWDAPDEGTDAAVALADIDDDGDLDLFVGSNTGNVVVYNNTGSASSPAWTENTNWLVPDIGATSNPSVGDLDDDGDLDILVGELDGITRAFKNTGTNRSPVWTRHTDWDIEDVGMLASPALGDLDGDGDLDVLVGEFDGGDSYGFENQPRRADNGTFSSNAIGVGKVVNWTSVDWGEDLPSGTDVSLYTRSGNTTDPDDGTWSSWSSTLSNPAGTNTTTPPGLYIQVRAELTTNDNSTTPQLWSINITYWYYTQQGAIETNDLVPPDLVRWGQVTSTNDSKGETIEIWYSTNSGSGWTTVPSDGDLSSVDTSSGKIRFRINMSTAVPTLTPVFTGIDLTFMRLMTAHHLHLDPLELELTVGDTYQFVYEFHDINNNTLNRTLSWTTDVGTVDTDGKFTAQTAPGTGHVNVSLSSIRASAQVTVKAGPLSRLNITPSQIVTVVGSSVQASAKSYDAFDNELSGLTLNWSSDVGTPSPASGQTTDLTVQTVPGSGYLRVSVGGINTSIPVTVLRGPLARIAITPTSIIINESASIQVSAKGYDQYDNVIPSASFDWATDAGTVAPSSGPNTTFTAQEVDDNLTDQTVFGNLSTTNGSISSSINVTVLGKFVQWLTRLVMEPGSVEILPVETATFNLTAFDQFDGVMDVTATWSSDVGTMSPTEGPSSVLKPNVDEGHGKVTATVGQMSVSADVTVLPNETYPFPRILDRIPDQIKFEDSSAWALDLNMFEGGGQDDDVLLWHLEGVDKDLFSVSGDYEPNDILVFTPAANAFGNNKAILVLEDPMGFNDTQALWINITPVDDPPVLKNVPDLLIRFDDPYTFNYMPYVEDIDTAIEAIVLTTTLDPVEPSLEQLVTGLKVTYTAPETLVDKAFKVTLSVKDDTTTVKDTFQLKVSDNYVPLLLDPLPDISLREGERKDGVFDLDDYFFDKDKDVIFFTYGNKHVEILINENHTVDVASTSQWYGKEIVTFRATDSKGSLVEDDILVTVTPFDDAPVIDAVPDLTVHFDTRYAFDLTPYIEDVDTPLDRLELTFSDEHVKWAFDPEYARAHPPVTGTARLTMVMDFPLVLDGQVAPYDIQLTITVTDGSGQDSDTVAISVTDNWPPEVSKPLPDVEFDEDTMLTNAFKLSDHFKDKDGQPLTFSVRSEALVVRMNDDLTVDISAPKDWNGIEKITFRAKDDLGAVVEDTLFATVKPVNDAPEIGPIPSQAMEEKTLHTLDLKDIVTDVDHDFSTLSIEISGSDMTLNAFMTGTSVVIFANLPGNFTLTIKVTDPSGGMDEASFNVDVTKSKTPGPRPPTDDSLLGTLFWPIIVLILLLAAAIGGFTGYRRYYGKFVINEAFVILRDGRLVAHISRHPDSKKDETLFSGMVAAVQLFIEDTFKGMKASKASTIQKMEFKGNTIMVERGKHMYLAILLKGESGSKIYSDMSKTLENLEEKYGPTLKEWEGDLDSLKEMSYDLLDILPGGYSKTIPGAQK